MFGLMVSPPSADDAPFVLVVFTCIVCTGVMANFTLVVPITQNYTESLLASALVVSAYAAGALVSLAFWSRLDHTAARAAYAAHGALMGAGNLAFGAVAWAARGRYRGADFYILLAARFTIGLEGGAMYNANLALIAHSAPSKHGKYLAMYQGFVGFGLVLGPAIAASAQAVGFAAGSGAQVQDALPAFLMAAWGFVLVAAVWAYLPADCGAEQHRLATAAQARPAGSLDEALAPEAAGSAPAETSTPAQDDSVLLVQTFLGNFLRIFQRLGWEVGAVLVLRDEFDWSLVGAGYALAGFGVLQGVAQFLFAFSARAHNAAVIEVLGAVELLSICGMFLKAPTNNQQRGGYSFIFVCVSATFYVANCLTSAPYNSVILERARGAAAAHPPRQAPCLRASQYGIFCAFAAAPLAVRGAMALTSVSAENLAAVLLLGWAAQAICNAWLLGGAATPLILAVSGATFGAIVWAVTDRSVGGTGAGGAFSWHPIFMALAFFGLMTPGQLVYRPDVNAIFGRDDDKAAKRKQHAALMVAATVVAVLAYACIFAAHVESGESQVGAGETASRTTHAVLGYVVLLWLGVQAAVGGLKERFLRNQHVRAFPWHGDSGKGLLLAGYAVATLGFWLKMSTNRGGWSGALKLSLTAGALVLFGFMALPRPAARAVADPDKDAPERIPDSERTEPEAGLA
ncbi:hypothetical protein M885DRAFT_496985 [Pelagophyceae sp. CCMP2097]|nr:hypothetical protein M885DRAFT_496985 [Pelagophyceae sp. CCMP2097]